MPDNDMSFLGNGADSGSAGPLDRTTARVVSELASRIVPELVRAIDAGGAERNAPQHGISEALARIEAKLPTLDKLEKQIRDSADEGRAGRQTMLQPLKAVADELLTVRSQIVNLADMLRNIKSHGLGGQQRDEALQKLSDGMSQLKDAVRDNISRQTELGKAIAELKPQAPQNPEAAAEQQEHEGRLTQLLGTSLPNWEGLLRAHTQAQTHELDSLSQELGNLQRQTHATLLQDLRDATAKEIAARDEEWEERMKAERTAMEKKIKSFAKALWFLAGVCLVSLGLAIAEFVR